MWRHKSLLVCIFCKLLFLFNDGMGVVTKNITKHFTEEEKCLHKKIRDDRNQYFSHTGTYNTSRVFEVDFNEKGLPDIGIRLLSKEYAGLRKYLAYQKLAEKVQNLILTSMRKNRDAIKEKLVVREKNVSDLVKAPIRLKSEVLTNINRIIEFEF